MHLIRMWPACLNRLITSSLLRGLVNVTDSNKMNEKPAAVNQQFVNATEHTVLYVLLTEKVDSELMC